MFEKFRAALSYRMLPSTVKKEVGQNNFYQNVLQPYNDSTPPKRGTKELLNSYNELPWLRAVTHKISHSVGITSWKLYVTRNGSGKTFKNQKIQQSSFDARQKYLNKKPTVDSYEEIEDHPLLALLSYGNDKLLGETVFQLTQIYMDLVGEAFWILERNGAGVPVGIWPLPPHWIHDLPTRDEPYYRVQVTHGKYKLVPVTEVIAFCDPDPVEPYRRGSGIAKSLGDELETDEYAAQHTKSFFYNKAKPDVIISGENLGQADTKRLEENWLQKHQGFWNAYKPHFLNREVKVTELGHSFDDMQLTELRKHERDTIIQVYGIPPEKLGILSASNRSTILSSDLFYTKDVIMPRVEAMRSTLQRDLVPMFDERLILDFESPVIDDKEHQLDVMKSMPGHFTRNEWRDLAQIDSLGDDGEVFIIRAGEMVVGVDEEGPKPGDGTNSVSQSGAADLDSTIQSIKEEKKLYSVNDEPDLTVDDIESIDVNEIKKKVLQGLKEKKKNK